MRLYYDRFEEIGCETGIVPHNEISYNGVGNSGFVHTALICLFLSFLVQLVC
jgi:hypothetical protein